MTDDEIRSLIDKKVAETKLDVTEKRLGSYLTVGAIILGLFGVVYPLITSHINSRDTLAAITEMKNEMRYASENSKMESDRQSNKVEESIEKMNGQFKELEERQRKQFMELAGIQLRKPEIVCFYNGKSIEGAVIKCTDIKSAEIQIKNIGDAAVENVRIKIYAKTPRQMEINTDLQMRPSIIDDPDYNYAIESYDNWMVLDPKESQKIELCPFLQKTEIPILLKIFYKGPEPKIYKFTLINSSSE